MFPSLSIGNTNIDAQFNSNFSQGNRKMEIRKLDPSNPADAERLAELNADDGLYHGDDDFVGDDNDDDDGLYHGDDELDHDIDNDMEDDEHRLDYINKLNEQ